MIYLRSDIKRPDVLYEILAEVCERLDVDGAPVTPVDLAGAKQALCAAYDTSIRSVDWVFARLSKFGA